MKVGHTYLHKHVFSNVATSYQNEYGLWKFQHIYTKTCFQMSQRHIKTNTDCGNFNIFTQKRAFKCRNVISKRIRTVEISVEQKQRYQQSVGTLISSCLLNWFHSVLFMTGHAAFSLPLLVLLLLFMFNLLPCKRKQQRQQQ